MIFIRYEIDENNYITDVYFNCFGSACAEYTGNIPDGYSSLEDWASNANIQAYKIVDNNLVYDSVKDQELQAKWAEESQNNQPISPGGGITGDTLPIGSIVDYDGDTPPENWVDVDEEKHIITAMPGDNYTLNIGSSPKLVTVPLELYRTSVGSKVYLNGDGTVNVSKAKKVLVNAIAEISPYTCSENNLMQLRISRDGATSGDGSYVNIASTLVNPQADGGYMYSISTGQILEDVSNVDTLSLIIYSGSECSFMLRSARTYLTVEVIE